MNSMYQQLMQLPLFQGVSTEKITELVEKLPFHFLKYRSGEQIVTAGDSCTHIRFIVSGKVRMAMNCSRLKVSLEQTLSTPHVLAPDYLFGRDTAYPFTAYAEGPCGILQLLKGDYIKMINTDKVFLFNILNYLSSGSQRGTSMALAARDGSVSERLAMLMSVLAVPGATDIVLKYKQKDLCSLLGTQRTTLIATLDKLSDQEILDYDSSEMRFLDLAGLMSLLKEE